MELERTTKQLKEAISIAGEETAKCKAAKEVIKSLTAQVKSAYCMGLQFCLFFMPTCNLPFSQDVYPILNSSMLVCYNQDTKLE